MRQQPMCKCVSPRSGCRPKMLRPLTGQATTIWLSAPALHVARTEDFGPENGTNNYNGVAITTWAGFSLKPRDLFDGTPLYKANPFPGLR